MSSSNWSGRPKPRTMALKGAVENGYKYEKVVAVDSSINNHNLGVNLSSQSNNNISAPTKKLVCFISLLVFSLILVSNTVNLTEIIIVSEDGGDGGDLGSLIRENMGIPSVMDDDYTDGIVDPLSGSEDAIYNKSAATTISLGDSMTEQKIRIWKWSLERRNILYIKVPKTGGTTLADGLSRLAKHSNWILAEPNFRQRVNTCGPLQEAETAWSYMVTANGGRIGVFASHACYRPFMKNKKYWQMRRIPRAITMMRHPWDHFISKYRFAQVCCEFREWAWCDEFCPKDLTGHRTHMTHTRYAEVACKNGRCNEQKSYMGTGNAQQVLDDYRVVLILERIDEGLAMLAVKLGFPFPALPYLRENTNNLVKVPNFTMEYRRQVQSTYLAQDMSLYRAAVARFDSEILAMNDTEKGYYTRVLSRLKEANVVLAEKCSFECNKFEVLTKPRKLCEKRCVEAFVDTLPDKP
jgi:hypothetical protein